MINHQLDSSRGLPAKLQETGIDPGYFLQRLNDTVIPQHQVLLAAARAAGAYVVYTTLAALRDDFEDVVPAARANMRRLQARVGTWGSEVTPSIAPQGDDLVLVKSGSSSFHTSQLDRYLRNFGVHTVLYTGVLSNACVLATALSGFDLGYRGLLVADCTATIASGYQAAAEEAALPFVERVINAASAAEALNSDASGRLWDSR